MSRHNSLHVWLVLMKAYKSMERRAVASIQATGLGLSDFQVLELLLHKGATPVNTIGMKIGLTSGSITTAIDRLAARGLVERKHDSHDRRSRLVHLTPAGTKLIQIAFAKHSTDMRKILSSLSNSELETLDRLLKSLGIAASNSSSTDVVPK